MITPHADSISRPHGNSTLETKPTQFGLARKLQTGESAGRWVVKIDGRMRKLSRLVWLHAHPGQSIPSGYHIHHINEDVGDDRPENLLCVSQAEHNAIHKRGVMAAAFVVAGVETKACRCCHENRPLSQFPRNGVSAARTPVYRPVCRACYAATQRSQRLSA